MSYTCYCRQPGDNALNMLLCIKCKCWFHEECVMCLDSPMLFGDRHFIFICSPCNNGTECLARLELTWFNIVHLALYNLNVIHKKKYFHDDGDIIPFILGNWDRYHLFGSIASVKTADRRSKIIETLHSYVKSFKCGREVKKSKHIWALRTKEPLDVPNVPSNFRAGNGIKWDSMIDGKSCQILTTKKVPGTGSNCKTGKVKTKLLQTSIRQKNNEVSKCRGSMPHDNGVQKSKHKVKRTVPCLSFNEETARYGLLDLIIPFPPNFNHINHPFFKLSDVNGSKYTCSNGHAVQTKSRKQICKTEDANNSMLQNGSYMGSESDVLQDTMSSFSRLYMKGMEVQGPAKDYFRLNAQLVNRSDFCIIGKRVTSGKVQYLFQKNRTDTEKLTAEKKPPFQITIRCSCCCRNW